MGILHKKNITTIESAYRPAESAEAQFSPSPLAPPSPQNYLEHNSKRMKPKTYPESIGPVDPKSLKHQSNEAAARSNNPEDASTSIDPKSSQHQHNKALACSNNPKDTSNANPKISMPDGKEAPPLLESFWPPDLIQEIRKVIITNSPKPDAPLFHFKLSLEAAHKNFCLMRRFNNSIGKALEAQNNSPLGYRSEFKPAATLAPLLCYHPNWNWFENLLREGSDWPLDDLEEEKRYNDVK